MITVTHFNDGKGKNQSHEITITEDDFYDAKHDIFSYNPFSITGYGETEEQALEDFKKKFFYVMDELKAFEKTLLETK